MHREARAETRTSPLNMGGDEFRAIGHQLVDRIAEFLDSLPERPVTRAESASVVREALGAERPLPAQGTDASALLDRAADLLFEHSLFNGHPSFWGYITSSAAPIGALGDLLASAVNPNVGAWPLSPMATEIEAQTIRWIAGILRYPVDCSGILVSGGNVANLVCFLAARQAKAGWNVRELGNTNARLR
ncbi:MAG TPA: pyridoxal-dependent decarboxylase, partial [Candidatus Acidoferrales bacterium]